MIHAYNDDFLPILQSKLASMFELASLVKKMPVDDFAAKFIASPICHSLEIADPVFVLGKSANELLGLVLHEPPLSVETDSFASPEFWLGYTLAYMQWYFNKPYSSLVGVFSCSDLLSYYFPYHEMDIRHSIELFALRLKSKSPLKCFRMAKHLSQSQLAFLSGVALRNIKAYEQGKVDISKAQAETLYALSKTLNCTMEDLIT